MAALMARGIGVDAQGANLRKNGVQGFLDLFGADASEFERICGMACRTVPGRRRKGISAEVAREAVVAQVESQGDIAMETFRRLAALGAPERSVIAASVEKENRLFACGNPLFDPLQQKL